MSRTKHPRPPKNDSARAVLFSNESWDTLQHEIRSKKVDRTRRDEYDTRDPLENFEWDLYQKYAQDYGFDDDDDYDLNYWDRGLLKVPEDNYEPYNEDYYDPPFVDPWVYDFV